MPFPTVTITPTSGASYVTGDYIGVDGVAAVFSPAGDATVGGSGGYILGAEFVDAGSTSAACEFWVFDKIPTPPADSAAWTITDAMAATLVAIIPFSTYYASAANSVTFGKPDNGAARFEATILYGCLVGRGTNGAGPYTVRLSIVQG
jgi:hypothetical protein